MSLRSPINVGSTAHEAPDAVWEVLIELEFAPTLTAEQIGALQDTLWERMEATIAETLGPHLHGAADTSVYTVRGRGAETPLFPLVAGDSRFTCNLDVVEAVERACVPADLRQLAYDARGRAYDLHVEIEYLRREEHDGDRRAELPDPGRVLEADRQRAPRTRPDGDGPSPGG